MTREKRDSGVLISEVHVRHFRSLRDATLKSDPLTAIVGPNGSGKSSFLKALELFYAPSAAYSAEDLYNGDTGSPIRISVTYVDLSEQERELFASHLDGDRLTVEKELAWPIARGSQKYFGSTLQHPPFMELRNVEKVTERRAAYRQLKESGKYPGLQHLPGNVSGAGIDEALRAWEQDHPDELERCRDPGQFFGFKEVGQAHLERYTRYVYIPAVREASEDATEGRGAVISELMDLVVRSALAQRKDVQDLRVEIRRRYEEVMDPDRLEELHVLEKDLAITLGMFAPGAGLELLWKSAQEVSVPLPAADVRIVEDGFRSAVERAGHGVQRAFVFASLQHLALAQDVERRPAQPANVEEEVQTALPLPGLILGIEEPELYQHPSRQRHLARVLFGLASGGIKGVADRTQVLYSTHSPLFVDLHRFDHVRLLRKESTAENLPKETRVIATTLDEVFRDLETAEGTEDPAHTVEGLRARLQTLMTPWTNEGFFADVVVLVEGEQDRAAILGQADAMGHDFDRLGIAVIPCMGKPNVAKAAAVFRKLEIPTYPVWDGDEGEADAKPEENRRLLRLLGAAVEDFPSAVADSFACFRCKLERTLKGELGEEPFQRLLDVQKAKFGYTKNEQALKTPLVVTEFLRAAALEDKTSPTLRSIVGRIVALRGDSGPADGPVDS